MWEGQRQGERDAKTLQGVLGAGSTGGRRGEGRGKGGEEAGEGAGREAGRGGGGGRGGQGGGRGEAGGRSAGRPETAAGGGGRGGRQAAAEEAGTRFRKPPTGTNENTMHFSLHQNISKHGSSYLIYLNRHNGRIYRKAEDKRKVIKRGR